MIENTKSQKQTENRLLIIGLDGATFDLIDPWIKEGILPNIQKLLNKGARARLRSTIQPVTAPAWTTMLTGVNQGKHGLYDFVHRREGDYGIEITNASDIHAPNIFSIASHYKKKVIAINIPYTFPPHPVYGIMIGGPFAPAVTPQLTYPVTFYETLMEISPNYFVMPEYDARHPNPLDDYAKTLTSDFDVRLQLCSYLLRHEQWDIFMVVFMAIDEAQHAFWHFHETSTNDDNGAFKHTIRDIYRKADETIGALIDLLDQSPEQRPTNIVLVSDHGGGALHAIINLNQWLAEEKFLYFLSSKKGLLKILFSKFVSNATSAYRQYMPVKLRAYLRNHLKSDDFDFIKGQIETVLYASTVDWRKTQLYALGSGGNLYVNLKGREPMGIVEPGEEYNKIIKKAIHSLKNLQDPENGKSIVRNIYRREELYTGPYLEQAPDLVIEWADYGYWGRGRYDSQAPLFEKSSHMEFTTLPLTGAHRPDGIFIASGPSIKPLDIKSTSITNIAPTLLNLINIPPSSFMDGSPLTNIFKPEAYKQITERINNQEFSLDSYKFTEEEEQIITDHLRALGYL